MAMVQVLPSNDGTYGVLVFFGENSPEEENDKFLQKVYDLIVENGGTVIKAGPIEKIVTTIIGKRLTVKTR